MDIYWLTRKDISSSNIGVTYCTHHGITFPWLATFHSTSLHCTHHSIALLWFNVIHGISLLWLFSPSFCFSLSSLDTLLWAGGERVRKSVPAHVYIWCVLHNFLNISSELPEGITLQWFGEVVGQYVTCQAIFDLQVPHFYYILNQ